VRLTWTPSSSSVGLHQLSPANATISGDAEYDVEVVRQGSREFTCGSPAASGVVFVATAQGRRPLVGTRVLYSINDRAGFDMETETDAEGQYQFCQIPRGVGRVGAGNCNDAAFYVPVEVNGDLVTDIDLTSFNASCP
jgi:hypothetical protein